MQSAQVREKAVGQSRNRPGRNPDAVAVLEAILYFNSLKPVHPATKTDPHHEVVAIPLTWRDDLASRRLRITTRQAGQTR